MRPCTHQSPELVWGMCCPWCVSWTQCCRQPRGLVQGTAYNLCPEPAVPHTFLGSARMLWAACALCQPAGPHAQVPGLSVHVACMAHSTGGLPRVIALYGALSSLEPVRRAVGWSATQSICPVLCSTHGQSSPSCNVLEWLAAELPVHKDPRADTGHALPTACGLDLALHMGLGHGLHAVTQTDPLCCLQRIWWQVQLVYCMQCVGPEPVQKPTSWIIWFHRLYVWHPYLTAPLLLVSWP